MGSVNPLLTLASPGKNYWGAELFILICPSMPVGEICLLRVLTGVGGVLRWQRNRTGRPLSPPQIHRKNIWMLSNPTKQLLNAGRGHKPPRKAAHCLWKEVRQNIKDKKRDKRVWDGDLPREGSLNRGEVSKHQETLSPVGLGEVFESQRAT